MIANPSYNYISPEEYLELEETSSIKHEYRQGQVYAMAGASNTHVVISGNVFAMLRNHLRGKGCQAYISDTKAHIEKMDIYYYPDVIVSCDSRDKAFNNFLRYPCLIIEVLSPTTEAFDRGDKFADYRNLTTLQEYVLVSQNKINVDVFRRNSEGQWVLYSYGKEENLHLASVDFQCSINDVYEDVNFESPS
ncbi:Uma2 family endonuclease [Anabaena aphanizomenioides LEGE 00250]|jgi:Uma2 family endonuclease|uniref:Uma2 family endonuclease n=1 Tax=Sphaerospermopsis aphanizomenoides LEGE 00250 TaxID=2777972 RepID=A0ABR9V9Q3_9CYAN|nr:Uma2 family endonuclease [Sphaerospermopsis aphanizomenoides]MBE9235233.1 Uma2 family endonuclease [Sphaerospermopsis aphanizomenoides LEGE 00250]